MSTTLHIDLPESLHKRLLALATQDGVSLDQFVSTAVAEKIAALATEEYLAERARRGDKAKFQAALSQVPDVEPETADRLPPTT